MNHIYKVIFCHATNTFIAVAELAKSKTKVSSSNATPAVTSPSGEKKGNFSKNLILAALISAFPALSIAAFSDLAPQDKPNPRASNYGNFNIFLAANSRPSSGSETPPVSNHTGAASLGLDKLSNDWRGANNIV